MAWNESCTGGSSSRWNRVRVSSEYASRPCFFVVCISLKKKLAIQVWFSDFGQPKPALEFFDMSGSLQRKIFQNRALGCRFFFSAPAMPVKVRENVCQLLKDWSYGVGWNGQRSAVGDLPHFFIQCFFVFIWHQHAWRSSTVSSLTKRIT